MFKYKVSQYCLISIWNFSHLKYWDLWALYNKPRYLSENKRAAELHKKRVAELPNFNLADTVSFEDLPF